MTLKNSWEVYIFTNLCSDCLGVHIFCLQSVEMCYFSWNMSRKSSLYMWVGRKGGIFSFLFRQLDILLDTIPKLNKWSLKKANKVSYKWNLSPLLMTFSLCYFKCHQTRFHCEPMRDFILCTGHLGTSWVLQIFPMLAHFSIMYPPKLYLLKSQQISWENYWSLDSCQARSGRYAFLNI